METIMASELKGRPVVSLAAADKIGNVNTVILDPATNRMLALKVKHGLIGSGKTLLASDIRNIGVDAVTINDHNLLHEHETDLPELGNMPTLEELTALKVVSESGTLLGVVGDVEIDPEQYNIVAYEMNGSLWEQLTRREKRFAALQGIKAGKDLLVVPDSVVTELGNRSGGEPKSPPEEAVTIDAAPASERAIYAPSAEYQPATESAESSPPSMVSEAAPVAGAPSGSEGEGSSTDKQSNESA